MWGTEQPESFHYKNLLIVNLIFWFKLKGFANFINAIKKFLIYIIQS